MATKKTKRKIHGFVEIDRTTAMPNNILSLEECQCCLTRRIIKNATIIEATGPYLKIR